MKDFKKAIEHLEKLNFLVGETQKALAQNTLSLKNGRHAVGKNSLALISATELAIYLQRDRFSWPRSLAVAEKNFDASTDALSADAKLLLFEQLLALRVRFVDVLRGSKFSPAARVDALATFLGSTSCLSTSLLANQLNVSVTTATRWLLKCAGLGLVRHVKVAEVSFWVVEPMLQILPSLASASVSVLRAPRIEIARADLRWSAPSCMHIDSQFLPVVEPPF